MKESSHYNHNQHDVPQKAFWIPFGLTGLFVAIIGWFKFDDSGLEKYLLFSLLIGFAIAVFPWIKTFKIKGLFELERSLGKIQEDTNQQFRELRTYLNVLQSQVTTQKAIQGQNLAITINQEKIVEEDKQEEEKEIKKLTSDTIELKEEDASWFSSIINKAGLLLWQPLISESCKKRSLDINNIIYNQAFSISGDLSQDPLLSLMDKKFAAILPTRAIDIFFEIQLAKKTNEEIHKYLFHTLSFLEKYRNAKAKQYKLILQIIYGEKIAIQKNRAEAIREYINTIFIGFISSDKLEIDLCNIDNVFIPPSAKNKSNTKDDTN